MENSGNLIIINRLSTNINNVLTNSNHHCQYTAIDELPSSKITKYENTIFAEILEKRGSNHIPIWENSESFKWDWYSEAGFSHQFCFFLQLCKLNLILQKFIWNHAWNIENVLGSYLKALSKKVSLISIDNKLLSNVIFHVLSVYFNSFFKKYLIQKPLTWIRINYNKSTDWVLRHGKLTPKWV